MMEGRETVRLDEIEARLGSIYADAVAAIDAFPGNEHFHTSLHGAAHSKRVLLFALLMADAKELSDEDRQALSEAAVYHDTQRFDDWLDVGHGARAADAYLAGIESPTREHELVAAIMRYHDQHDELGEEQIGREFGARGVMLYRIFKDADALDRFRIGPDALDVRYLSNPEATELIDLARELNATSA